MNHFLPEDILLREHAEYVQSVFGLDVEQLGEVLELSDRAVADLKKGKNPGGEAEFRIETLYLVTSHLEKMGVKLEREIRERLIGKDSDFIEAIKHFPMKVVEIYAELLEQAKEKDPSETVNLHEPIVAVLPWPSDGRWKAEDLKPLSEAVSPPSPTKGEVAVFVTAYPPEGEKEDSKRLLEGVIEALVETGVIEDEFQVAEIHLVRRSGSMRERVELVVEKI